jgi:hypothetical protein
MAMRALPIAVYLAYGLTEITYRLKDKGIQQDYWVMIQERVSSKIEAI